MRIGAKLGVQFGRFVFWLARPNLEEIALDQSRGKKHAVELALTKAIAYRKIERICWFLYYAAVYYFWLTKG